MGQQLSVSIPHEQVKRYVHGLHALLASMSGQGATSNVALCAEVCTDYM